MPVHHSVQQDETNPEVTGYNCAACDKPDHEDTGMVFCEKCQRWYHYRCAEVTESIKDRSWIYENCVDGNAVKNVGGKPVSAKAVAKKLCGKIASAETGGTAKKIGDTADSDIVNAAKKSSEKIEAESERPDAVEKQVDEETVRELAEFREAQRRNFQRQLLLEKEKRKIQLELEREMLEMRKAADLEFQEQRSQMWMEYHQEENADKAGSERSSVQNRLKVEKWMRDQAQSHRGQNQDTNVPADHQGAYPKHSTPILNQQPEAVAVNNQQHSKQTIAHHENVNNDAVKSNERTCGNRTYSASVDSEYPEKVLTHTQLAARKGPFKKLPVFTGRIEEWPLFISSFNNGNRACNYSNLDNLGRLQESLKGAALEAVRSRLLYPESVPQVIDTLRKRFGRPEQLLYTLLNKARKAEAPRIDRLSSFIPFGTAVQEFCDHLVAADLRDYLISPTIVAELVNKLPSATQLEWVRYKQQHEAVTLQTLADFLSNLVTEVSEVTVFVDVPPEQIVNRGGRDWRDRKKNVKEYEGFLHTHIEGANQLQIQLKSVQESVQQKEAENYRKPCKNCNRIDHHIRYCEDFRKLSWNERMREVEKHKLCHLCLNEHGQSRCRFRGHCRVEGCKERHHQLLHPPVNSEPLRTANCNIHTKQSQSVIFRMVPVRLHNGKHFIDVIAFIDEGSSYSLIEEEVADQIKLTGVVQPILVKWTAGKSRLERDSRRLHVTISAKDSNERFHLRNVHTVERLQLPEQGLRFAEMAARYEHLCGLPVVDYLQGAPRILIGLKHLHVYAPIESRIGQPGEPIAVRTPLGWTIYGPQDKNDAFAGFMGHHSTEFANEELHELLKMHYTLDESGPSVTVLPESADNQRVREILEKTTVRVGDRFVTGLLWKVDKPKLPDSFPMAVKRMKSLKKKLLRNPELQQAVQSQILDYQKKGYAHKATVKELAEAEIGKVWYLPLNVVVNPKKPGKVRLVWDAAASVRGISLNSVLLKGPDLLTSLPSVISCFREKRIAFGGDIKEMYHQLQILDGDKQSQRFLYRKDFAGPPEIYVMDVATFGSSSSPCSAQFIKNKNAQEYADQYPDAAQAIIDKHYVDDYYDSADTVCEAVKRAREVKLIHSKAGFHIRNWISNSAAFLKQLGEEQTDQIVHFSFDKTNNTQRVLGVSWNSVEDVFVFSSKIRDVSQHFETSNTQPTKREVLSYVMSLFDPLGMLAPYTIHGRLIIQDLWRQGCSWDEQIDEQMHDKWRRWTALMAEVENIKIPRCYFLNATETDYKTLQLHVFTDASESAYGCVAYFRLQIYGHPKCALVSAKAKVAPLKHLSIPRMELQAALLGCRLAQTVKQTHALPITQRFCWTDSRTVLSWIRSDHRKYSQFVAFRIGEILSQSALGEWRWVATKNNIADVLTKWGSGPPVQSDGEWVMGSEMLYQPEDKWPKHELPPANIAEELRAHFLFHEIVLPQTIIDTCRFSRWKALVRTVACVYRFLSNCNRKLQGLPIEGLSVPNKVTKGMKQSASAILVPLKQEEYRRAENYLWRVAQQEVFSDELKIMLKNVNLSKEKSHQINPSSILYKRSPILDEDGIIRMEGRAAYADFIPFELRFPIVLPGDHDITRKLLQHYHLQYGHANQETVVNEVRQRFFIPKLRAAIRRITKQCYGCKVRKCQPTVPRMAPLPSQRLIPFQRPFSFVGVDYFGPVTVTVGRRKEKRWVALFTCLVTRAIHLEVAHSLTSQACLMAIRRFICRRGAPSEIFSDNGTNFKAASKEFTNDAKRIDLECANELTDARTRWNFIPPSAPHMGGSWERMVRSTKDALKAVNDGRKLTDEVFLTILAEAEDMVNSRPLTYLPQESAEIGALTPNHFLRGLPSGEREEMNKLTSSAEALRDSYKRSQMLADILWQRWIKEYIPLINHRTKWHDEKEAVEEGELVYVVDGDNRRTWVRGIVEQVIRGQDGRTRQAMVRTSKGVLRRPVAKLATMELKSKTGPWPDPAPELREGELLAPLGALTTRK